jgi:hypothetical protein
MPLSLKVVALVTLFFLAVALLFLCIGMFLSEYKRFRPSKTEDERRVVGSHFKHHDSGQHCEYKS